MPGLAVPSLAAPSRALPRHDKDYSITAERVALWMTYAVPSLSNVWT